MKSRLKQIHPHSGFTLVEILVVVSIISMLFLILIPQINASFIKSQEAGVKSDFRTFQLAMESYMRESKGKNLKLKPLNDHLDKGHSVSLVGTMMQTNSHDPWGTPYEVEFGNRKSLFSSYGKDEVDDENNYIVATYYHEGIIDSCTTGFDSGNIKLSSITDVPIGFSCGDNLASVMTTPKDSLPAPKNFVATSVTHNQATLSWDSVIGATSYILKRNGITIYMGSSTSYTNVGLTAGTQYTYTVSAKNANADSALATVKATTVLAAPGTPTHLVASNVTDAAAVLSWNSVPRATSYKLARNGVVIYTGPSNSFSDSGLDFSKPYSYSLTAINATGQSSPYSITVTTKLMEFGEGHPTNPYIIYNVEQLQRVAYCLTCHFELGTNIDASGATSWNSGAGFDPIRSRTSESYFSGQLDGKNFTIRDMTITRPTEDWVAIFDYLNAGAILKNIKIESSTSIGNNNIALLVGGIAEGAVLQNIQVSGSVSGNEFVGGIAGYSEGQVIDSSSDAIVGGHSGVGGIIGENYGNGQNLSFNGSVSGDIRSVGGLIGYNEGTLSQLEANGNVSGLSNAYGIGGAVGEHYNNLTTATSSASVSGTRAVGGLVGINGGSVELATFNGNIKNSHTEVGGIVGYNDGDLNNAETNADVEGVQFVGGTIGRNLGHVQETLFNGNVEGETYVGGAIGMNELAATLIQTNNDADVQGIKFVGGIVGHNKAKMSDLTFTGTIAGVDSNIGGLAGFNTGEITDATISATVSAEDQAGGVVGDNDGIIERVDFSGEVTGYDRIGGIVGTNDGEVYDSTSRANVNGDNNIGGAFGYSGSGGYIENVTSRIGTVVDGGNYIGGIIGHNSSEVLNLTSHAKVSGYEAIGGVFGFTQNITTNLISSGIVSGNNATGGIAGDSYGEIYNASSTSPVSGDDRVGGISGYNLGLIQNSTYNGNVEGDLKVGGIAGENDGLVSKTYALGSVDGNMKVGGLVGLNYDEISYTYAKNTVTGVGEIGGLVGVNMYLVKNSYSIGYVNGTHTEGGLIGLNTGTPTVTNSYYNNSTSGQSDTGKGTGRTTTQMKSQSTFVGWNFTSVWTINASVNEGYPTIR